MMRGSVYSARLAVATSGITEVQGNVMPVSRDAGNQRPAVRSGLRGSYMPEVINEDALTGPSVHIFLTGGRGA